MRDVSLLKKRAEIIRETRNFFVKNNYLEVETPVLSPHLIPESHLEVFRTKMISPYSEDIDFYLTPSPEIWMKKLLAEGSGSIFQISKSFRNSEQSGFHHNPEFTMLEWYTVEADYRDSLIITESLLDHLSQKFNCRQISPPIMKISMKELFLTHTAIDIEKYGNSAEFIDAAEKAGYGRKEGYSWADAFNSLFLSEVEPEIPKESPFLIMDYPDQIPCLAKRSRNGPWHERWELYLGGIETANCYTEESDKKAVDRFFREQMRHKTKAMVPHHVEESYTSIFESSFPECSGVALGIDRLVMAITGAKRIQDVISFTF
ncbi:MAG: amino acid--tRNA ligase-related protein [Spirochaetia bacterium]|jgi:lysyl-tRNA synthetase class 2|nr:amino acid--tRNA ligase-related protein [Spirochaetia bacterium]